MLINTWNRKQLTELRNGLIDIVLTCVSTEETKEATDSQSLFMAISLVEDINMELEKSEKKV
jgi:hypothetical protein